MKFIDCALNTRPRPPETAGLPPVPITVLVVLRLPTLKRFKIGAVQCGMGFNSIWQITFNNIQCKLNYVSGQVMADNTKDIQVLKDRLTTLEPQVEILLG